MLKKLKKENQDQDIITTVSESWDYFCILYVYVNILVDTIDFDGISHHWYAYDWYYGTWTY